MLIALRIFIVVTALLLNACGGPTVKVQLLSAKQLNPNSQGKSLPVQVRMYTLSSDTAFKQASFKDLWKHDKAILGESLIDSKEFMLSPQTRGQICFTHNRNAHYVGIIAVYRHPKNNQWRIIEKIPSFPAILVTPIKVYFNKNMIKVDKQT